MASSDESVRFIGETHPDDDLFETTLKRVGHHSAGLSSGRRWSQRQTATTSRKLVDEEDDEGGDDAKASFPREEEKRVGR
ncbi:UNVERIFIED_CONTAM: hypothetical protein Sradi_6508100 [Sesamum radiatum]|uniref:Uncharacterized protein n=1 Tax=Sesamum radiatum TaxID=300843 RepID=A0AAW2JWP7_SESRA